MVLELKPGVEGRRCAYVRLQDIEKEKRRARNPEAMEEDETSEEAVSENKAANFEEAMKSARRSVSDADIREYAPPPLSMRGCA